MRREGAIGLMAVLLSIVPPLSPIKGGAPPSAPTAPSTPIGASPAPIALAPSSAGLVLEPGSPDRPAHEAGTSPGLLGLTGPGLHLGPPTAEAAAPAPLLRRVYLQPLGTAPSAGDLAAVRSAIEQAYGFEVRELAGIDLPPDAYYAPRRRYRAEKLLRHLAEIRPADGFRILGITARDVSTTHDSYPDWGVVGLASYDEPVGIISSYRTARSVSASRSETRLARVAVHEIGHTLGLEHCPAPGCVMRDAAGSVSAIDDGRDLCASCRAKLGSAGYALPDPPAPTRAMAQRG